MNIDDLIETLVEARAKGIKWVELKEIYADDSWQNLGGLSHEMDIISYRYEDPVEAYTDEQRKSVVLVFQPT